ncbi:MAG: redoxin domain-containing protein [Bacteroidota bacterium]
MRFRWIALLLVLFTSLRVNGQVGLDVKVNYQSSLDAITLTNYDGFDFDLSSYRNKDLTVYIFLGHECPICQKYGHTLRTFHEEFQKKNIDIIGIVPLRDVGIETIAEYVELYDFKFPVLSDRNRILTDVVKATVTPEIIMVDNKGDLIYRGMIDNWFYALGKYRRVTTEFYLQDAIEAYLSNQQVAVQKTDPIGCFINMTNYSTN